MKMNEMSALLEWPEVGPTISFNLLLFFSVSGKSKQVCLLLHYDCHRLSSSKVTDGLIKIVFASR